MPIPRPVFMYMAGGAMIAGGGALLEEAKRASAEEETLRAKKRQADLIQAELRLDEMKKQARARGLDPDLVVQEAEIASTRLSMGDVAAWLDKQ